MKNAVVVTVLLLGMALSAFAGGGQEDSEQTFEFSCGSVDAIGTFSERSVQLIADTLAELSEGRLKIKSFPANQLGNPPEMIDQCSMGALDMLFVNISNFGPVMKDYNVFGMGYTFRSQEHLIKFLEESDDYKRMKQELLDQKGIITLDSTFMVPPRDVFSKKEIKKPEDFKGMKFRVPGLEMYLKTFEAMGTEPVRIAYGEAYMALSQGLVEGIENPLDSGSGMKFHQVAKYIVPTGHIRSSIVFAMNDAKWQQLTPKNQELLMKAIQAGKDFYTNQMQSELAAIRKKMTDEGAVFLPPIDITGFQAKLAETAKRQEAAGAWTAGMWERIQAIK
jgi:tripartite ATP-independent transporter DctP family solute receptor